MAIGGVNTPELWTTGFAFMVLAVAALFEGVVLLDVRTLDIDGSLPATAAIMGVMLTL